MSLKAFHVVFVTASTLLALGFGIWALGEGRELTAWGIGSLILAALLPVYGRWFLQKMKNESFL